MFYTNVARLGNKLLVRGYDNGIPFTQKVQYTPSLYISSKNTSEWTGYISNEPVSEINLESMTECRDFIKKYEGVEGVNIYGTTSYEVSYISDKWTGIVNYDYSKIRLAYIDIETTSENGFPNHSNPIEEILLITVNKTTFSCRPYSGENQLVRVFNSEERMLKEFLLWWHNQKFDIITGWNVEGFDIPYICQRILKVLDADWLSLLSPWKKVSERNATNDFGTDFTSFEIFGISVLDYIALYKKFTYIRQESYSLDFICEYELNETKLENPFGTFKEFYTNDYDIFVEYNIRDVLLVQKLDDKLKLLELAVAIAYHAKVNFNTVFSPVATWDAIINNYLKSNKIVPPLRGGGKKLHSTEGAYVEDPITGKLYKWILSIDATSLYPSIMQAWNISPETYLGVKEGVSVKSMFNKEHDVGNYTLAANGAMYSRDHEGYLGKLIQSLFELRKVSKKNMLDAKKRKEKEGESREVINDISRWDNMQMAAKILLNSLYGATSNPHFRYFNIESARAITLTGQYIITTVKQTLNEILNKLFKTVNYQYVTYLDTDSVYITLEPYVNEYCKGLPEDEIIEKMSLFCDETIQKMVDHITNGIQKYSNTYKNTISFKQEVCASSGFWRAKKNYALKVHRSEGVVYKEPEYKIMGMEAVRSSTPKVVREELKNIIEVMLNKDINEVRNSVEEFRSKYIKMSVYDVSKPTSCNGIDMYSDSNNVYKKGCPIHIRAALIYNNLIKKHNLSKKYDTIKDGDKIRYVYLKLPNPTLENVIGYIDVLPSELNLEKYIDYNLQFEKLFESPVESMCKAISWELKEISTLDDFLV